MILGITSTLIYFSSIVWSSRKPRDFSSNADHIHWALMEMATVVPHTVCCHSQCINPRQQCEANEDNDEGIVKFLHWYHHNRNNLQIWRCGTCDPIPWHWFSRIDANGNPSSRMIRIENRNNTGKICLWNVRENGEIVEQKPFQWDFNLFTKMRLERCWWECRMLLCCQCCVAQRSSTCGEVQTGKLARPEGLSQPHTWIEK